MFGYGASASRRDARPDSSNTATPNNNKAQPSSPTLTNPDMILPDYDYGDAIYLDGSVQSPVMTWNGTHYANQNFQMPQQSAFFNGGPLTPSTPIIYGNGTMLSDIGEVTEVESNAGGRLSRRNSVRKSNHTNDGTPLRSSPTIGPNKLKKKAHQVKRERRASVESTSTVGAPEPPTVFADFDESRSVCDSSFQGDDEESLASSFIHDVPTHHPYRASAQNTDQEENIDRYSTASISTRAEQILANAKRRLTTMEGNLNKARTFSYSSASDGSTPSPPVTRSGVNPPLQGSVLPATPNHGRNMSGNSLPGPAKNFTFPQRSASALGAAGGYRQPLPPSKSADALGGRPGVPSNPISQHPLDTTLEPLGEDEDDDNKDALKHGSIPPTSFASPTFSTYSDAGLTRSVSVAQVRDLQDQMSGLKGKISSLRDQARADSMKRRSLQSLRTPSPFTHARWDLGLSEPRSVQTPEPEGDQEELEIPWDDDVGGDVEKNREEERATSALDIDDDVSVMSGYYEAQAAYVHPRSSAKLQELGSYDDAIDRAYDEDQDDLRTEDGDFRDAEENEEAAADNMSESGESLYHDTQQNAISHEDREDAFDYERFFLHSAMGSLSRQGGRRDSSASDDSDNSVETTRGPTQTRARRLSVDTTTSVDTFATAAEEEASRTSTVQDYREDMTGTPDGEFAHDVLGKRLTFEGSESSSDDTTNYHDRHRRQVSVLHRPISNGLNTNLHRPSVSSFESTGTNRSFPLVNKARFSGGIVTPTGSSPDEALKRVRDSLMTDTATVYKRDSTNMSGGMPSPPMQMLSMEDQMSVERVVVSLGRCVLGLGDTTTGSTDTHQILRQRIEAARRILEGENE